MTESIYEEAVRRGWEFSSYYSDLYLAMTPETEKAVKERGLKPSLFIDRVTGKWTYDLFGEFTPYWEMKLCSTPRAK